MTSIKIFIPLVIFILLFDFIVSKHAKTAQDEFKPILKTYK